MTCKEVQDRLPGFKELGATEKERMLTHAETCGDCRDALKTMQWMDALIQQTQAVDLTPPHAAALTGRVMERIRADHPAGAGLSWLAWLESRMATFSLGAVSLVLVGFLIAEQWPATQATGQMNGAPGTGTVLNNKVFGEQLTKYVNANRHRSAVRCINPFRSAQQAADCLRQKYTQPI